jgi:hypothetical protein
VTKVKLFCESVLAMQSALASRRSEKTYAVNARVSALQREVADADEKSSSASIGWSRTARPKWTTISGLVSAP